MNNELTVKKIIHFPLTKILIGIAAVVGSVALVEVLRSILFDKLPLTYELKNGIAGITEAGLALLSYILLFRFYEKRPIQELNWKTFGRNAITGFMTGLILQSLIILVIYWAGGYSILKINPISFILP